MRDTPENTVPEEILDQITSDHLAIPTLTTRRRPSRLPAAAYRAGAASTRTKKS